jgi:hypothetical protein
MQNQATSHATPEPGYAARVLYYLSSPEGASTPLDIARRLLSLSDPESLGMGAIPTLAQLHRTRRALEDIAYLVAHDEASGALAPDDVIEHSLAILRRLRRVENDR